MTNPFEHHPITRRKATVEDFLDLGKPALLEPPVSSIIAPPVPTETVASR